VSGGHPSGGRPRQPRSTGHALRWSWHRCRHGGGTARRAAGCPVGRDAPRTTARKW